MEHKKLPRTEEELAEFKRDMAKMSPLELLKVANAAMADVNSKLNQAFPSDSPPVDTSKWTLEQKLAAGERLAGELRKLARNAPELRRIESLDASVDSDLNAARLAKQAIERASAGRSS